MNITIPTDWSDITLRQFKEISEVPSLGFKDELDSKLKVLSILTGEEDTVFLSIPMTALSELLNKTKFVYQKPEKMPLHRSIRLRGRKYEVNNMPSQLVAGEYIDLTELLKKDSTANLEKIIAIFLKPVNLFGGMKKGCYEKDRKSVV